MISWFNSKILGLPALFAGSAIGKPAILLLLWKLPFLAFTQLGVKRSQALPESGTVGLRLNVPVGRFSTALECRGNTLPLYSLCEEDALPSLRDRVSVANHCAR